MTVLPPVLAATPLARHSTTSRISGVNWPCNREGPPLSSARAGIGVRGEVAERLNAPHSKCGMGASPSGVRIPPSPPLVTANMLTTYGF
jgi:hypothetical protein